MQGICCINSTVQRHTPAFIGGNLSSHIQMRSVSLLTFWHACCKSFSPFFCYIHRPPEKHIGTTLTEMTMILKAYCNLSWHSKFKNVLSWAMFPPNKEHVFFKAFVSLIIQTCSSACSTTFQKILLFTKSEWMNWHIHIHKHICISRVYINLCLQNTCTEWFAWLGKHFFLSHISTLVKSSVIADQKWTA